MKIILCIIILDSEKFTACVFELLLHLLPNKKPKFRRAGKGTIDAWASFYENFKVFYLANFQGA